MILMVTLALDLAVTKSRKLGSAKKQDAKKRGKEIATPGRGDAENSRIGCLTELLRQTAVVALFLSISPRLSTNKPGPDRPLAVMTPSLASADFAGEVSLYPHF
jgi:hypothetical protein